MANYKQCPKCGGKYHPNTQLCPSDQTPLVFPGQQEYGTPLAGDPTIGMNQPPPVPQYSYSASQQPYPQKKRPSGSGIVLAVVLGIFGLVVVIGVIVIANLSGSPGSSDSGGSPRNPFDEKGAATASTAPEYGEFKAKAYELNISASSTFKTVGQTVRTDAAAMLDGDMATSWCENEQDSVSTGTKTDGTNAIIRIESANQRVEELARIAITPGYIKGLAGKARDGTAQDYDRWPRNNRVKRLELTSSSGNTIEITLDPNDRSLQSRSLPPGFRGMWFKIRILEVVKGEADDNDLCISEVELYFRRQVGQ